MFRFNSENAREMQLRSARSRMMKCSRERRRLIARQATLSRWYSQRSDPLKRVDVYLRYLARLAATAEKEGCLDEAASIVCKMFVFERYKTALEFRDIRMLGHCPAEAVASNEPESLDNLVTQFSPSELLAKDGISAESEQSEAIGAVSRTIERSASVRS